MKENYFIDFFMFNKNDYYYEFLFKANIYSSHKSEIDFTFIG
jgi:hypothetical protein